MYYNVAQLLKEPVGSTWAYDIEGPLPKDLYSIELSPPGHISMMRTDRGILVSAEVDVDVWVTCSRCLKRTPSPVQISIEEEFLPTIEINSGHSLSLHERSEGVFTIDRQHGLDLGEPIRQYTITNQPMKPLCIENCQGLCPDCGADNNEIACACPSGSIDPRWAPLGRLLQTGDEIVQLARKG